MLTTPLGLSLDSQNDTNAVIAGAAKQKLGSNLDSMLLGNVSTVLPSISLGRH